MVWLSVFCICIQLEGAVNFVQCSLSSYKLLPICNYLPAYYITIRDLSITGDRYIAKGPE